MLAKNETLSEMRKVAIIRRAVECCFAVPLKLMRRSYNVRRFVDARSAFINLCRLHTKLSYPEIARMLGYGNHSVCVVHSDNFASRMLNSYEFAKCLISANDYACEMMRDDGYECGDLTDLL